MHKKVFEVVTSYLMAEWVDYKDPNTTKQAKKVDLRSALPEFPWRPAGWAEGKDFTRADFAAMSTE